MLKINPKSNLASMVPKGRLVLTVGEVADRLRIADRQVVDLIDGGEMVAVDVSGRRDCFPMPVEAVNQLAARLKVPPAQLVEFIRNCKRKQAKGRSCWRIPVVEGFQAFMLQRNSLNGARI